METKAELRKRLIQGRNQLSSEEVREKSALIFDRLCSLEQYQKAKTVLVYMDYRNEVMTRGFIQRCRREGKRVVLPKVAPDCLLELYEINEIACDTAPGFKGIPEPDSSRLRCMDAAEIDLAVVPGVAFDGERRRVGYGAGYYDRFLPSLRRDCPVIAVAYSLQLVENIEPGMYDIPMDAVITEDRILFDRTRLSF